MILDVRDLYHFPILNLLKNSIINLYFTNHIHFTISSASQKTQMSTRYSILHRISTDHSLLCILLNSPDAPRQKQFDDRCRIKDDYLIKDHAFLETPACLRILVIRSTLISFRWYNLIRPKRRDF